MKNATMPVKALVAGMAAAAVVLFAFVARTSHIGDYIQFVGFLAAAVIASRFKLKLPGLDGNMSMNVPFIVAAALRLAPVETMAIAALSALVQCWKRDFSKIRGIQVTFNVATIMVASLAAWCGTQASATNALNHSLDGLSATMLFFVVNSFAVAAVMSLAEPTSFKAAWVSIFAWSFPYYLLSAGLVTVIGASTHNLGAQLCVLSLPLMFAVYQSYKRYFAVTTA